MDNRLAPKSINALQQASMARAGPNTPAWWSDTNASWNPETGLDIYGNYGGPIGTSGPMGNAQYGLEFMNPNGPTPPPVGAYASEPRGGVPQGYEPPGYVKRPFNNFMPNAAAQGYNSSNYAQPTYAPSQRSGSYFGGNNSFTPYYGFNMNNRF